MLYHKIYKHDKNAPWVVFIHGFGGSSAMWHKQLRAFRERYNLLLIDLRGHGRYNTGLEVTKQTYTFRKISLEILEVLDHYSLRQCHFVGMSMGTWFIRDIADYNPAYIKSMVMGGAIVNINTETRILFYVADALKHVVPHMWFYRLYAHILMPRRRHKTSRNIFINDAMKMPRREFLNWYTLHVRANYARLREFLATEPDIPTIYVSGLEDYMFLNTMKRCVKRYISHAEVAEIKGAGHICSIDCPEEFNRIVLDFLARVDAADDR